MAQVGGGAGEARGVEARGEVDDEEGLGGQEARGEGVEEGQGAAGQGDGGGGVLAGVGGGEGVEGGDGGLLGGSAVFWGGVLGLGEGE